MGTWVGECSFPPCTTCNYPPAATPKHSLATGEPWSPPRLYSRLGSADPRPRSLLASSPAARKGAFMHQPHRVWVARRESIHRTSYIVVDARPARVHSSRLRQPQALSSRALV